MPGTDLDLLTRARRGDADAFGELVTRYADLVYALLRRFGLDRGEAEEVAQEVFLRAWRGLGGFQHRARFSTWLYRIAYNEAQRRISRRPPAPAPLPSDGADPIAEIADRAGRGPAHQALDRELGAVLHDALQRLPDEMRAAVVLRDVEGLSTEEAAEITGVRPAAFKSRLHRGRMQLRVLLEPYLALDGLPRGG